MGGVWHQIISDLASDRLQRYLVDPSYRVAYCVTRAGVIDLAYRWLTFRCRFTNGSTMTVHKVQGHTMGRVIVDLAGCTGTESPYVMVSRATSLDGLLVLRDFNHKQIAKRRSEELELNLNVWSV